MVTFRFIMKCNIYTPNSAVQNSSSQIDALKNNGYFDNNMIQPIAMDSDRSSDSLTCILNDLGIGFPKDVQNTIKMGTDNVNTLQASDTNNLNSSLKESNEENVKKISSCPGKKISLSSTLRIQFVVNEFYKEFSHKHSICLNYIIAASTINIFSSDTGNGVAAGSPSKLIQLTSDGNGNIPSNCVPLNSNNLGSFVLVPLSMLALPFSSNLKVVQSTNLESQSNLLQSSSPSSETRVISSSNVRRRGLRHDIDKTKNIPQGKSIRKESTGGKSNNKKDECGRARKENMVKKKTIASKNTSNNFQQTLHNKAENGSKAKYNLRRNIRGNDSTLCLVCGEKAGQYYGGKSCQSCRAFFRRSAHKVNR